MKQNFGEASNIRSNFRESTVFDINQFTIEEEVKSLKTSKSLDNPSGTFNISLFPTQSWKEKIAPGDWVAIYMFNRLETRTAGPIDSRNLVMLGNVDRISRNLEREEDSDKIKLKYEVSGRSFGKVFEDINVWYDPYANQDILIDVALRTAGLEMTGNPTSQVTQLLNVFLGNGQQFEKEKTSPLNQYRIPTAVAAIFNKTSTRGVVSSNVLRDNPSFYDILVQKIEPGLPGYRDRNMISAEDNGNLWENLQRASNDLVNEIFLEDVRGSDGTARPTIVLRPRPLNTPFFDSQFGLEKNQVKPRLNGKFKTLQELAEESFVEISQGEIFLEDLGRDDHSRFNMFWLTSNRSEQWNQSTYSHLRSVGAVGNPFVLRESVTRHGLKKMTSQWDFDRVDKNGGSAKNRETDLFKAFMVQNYDQNYANHLYDAGTIETSGVLEAELGKALVLLPDANTNNKKKIFYIQGYEHEWSFPNTWRTMFSVTHGQFKTQDLNIFIGLGIGTKDNSDRGTLDKAFDSAYIAKTQTNNKDKNPASKSEGKK